MLSSRDVLDASFTQTQMRRGYDEGEVDEFLDLVVEALRHYESGGSPDAAPDVGARPTSEPAHVASNDTDGVAEADAEPEAGAEGPGLGSRLGRLLRGDPK